jgi:2-oxoisovalerate ferredoxin oxidoreductase alpha subunit
MVKHVITGNYAVAYGAKVSRAEVIAAYPITPQTTIVEKIADFVADGELDAQYLMVESEHSAMAACIAASNTGARSFTATSAQGLALMHELLIWAAAARTPVVMANVNRAMGPPWSVWADHQDSIAQRDTGWIQFYCESSQEVFDTIIQSFKICENNEILLPGLLTLDAFYLSHTYEPVDIPDQGLIDEFLPSFDPPYKLDVDKPNSFGSLVMPHTWATEFKYKISEAMNKARDKIREVDREFNKVFGRSHGELVEFYRTEDAEVVLVGTGTVASTTREVVDRMRDDGFKVGLAKLRVFRPFPYEEIRELASSGVKAIGVMDRCLEIGYGGAVFTEICGSLYNHFNDGENKPILKNFITGVGGRDVTPRHITALFKNLLHIKDHGLDREIHWVELKDATRPEGEVL